MRASGALKPRPWIGLGWIGATPHPGEGEGEGEVEGEGETAEKKKNDRKQGIVARSRGGAERGAERVACPGRACVCLSG